MCVLAVVVLGLARLLRLRLDVLAGLFVGWLLLVLVQGGAFTGIQVAVGAGVALLVGVMIYYDRPFARR